MAKKLKIINVVGARPNFIKIGPIMKEMKRHPQIDPILLHTGQHYDVAMSQRFFEDLNIPAPDVNLEVGSGSHAEQTAQIMTRFEKVLMETRPDLVLVVGDVNSTLACTITAKKLLIKVAHVEAGLRSRDMTMPEEINRLVTDVLADYLFTTSEVANKNLESEGVAKNRIFYVGNIMIDTLVAFQEEAEKLNTHAAMGLERGNYVLLTMHRPSNVDDPDTLKSLLETLGIISQRLAVIFPIHPRTEKQIQKFGFDEYVQKLENFSASGLGKRLSIHKEKHAVYTCPPLGYKALLNLNMNAKLVITDSGGLQEETTVCGVPCLTIRENTERPETVSAGSNVVVGTDRDSILEQFYAVMNGQFKKGSVPPLWDGKTAQRIVRILLDLYS